MKKLVLTLMLSLLLCSCKTPNKAMVLPRPQKPDIADAVIPEKQTEPKETEPNIQQGVTADVMRTSSYSSGFYAIEDRYIIRDDRELEIFLGYMAKAGYIGEETDTEEMRSAVNLNENTVFVVPIESSSGGYTYTITSAVVEDNTFKLGWSSSGEGMTCDMAMFYPYAIVPDSLLEGVDCADWTAPSQHKCEIYSSCIITASFDLNLMSSLNPFTMPRQLAEKYNTVSAFTSLTYDNGKTGAVYRFELMDKETAAELEEELKAAGVDVRTFEDVIQLQSYEGKMQTLALDNPKYVISQPKYEIFIVFASPEECADVCRYFNTVIGEGMSDFYTSDDGSFCSCSSTSDITEEKEIEPFFEALKAAPCSASKYRATICWSISAEK